MAQMLRPTGQHQFFLFPFYFSHSCLSPSETLMLLMRYGRSQSKACEIANAGSKSHNLIVLSSLPDAIALPSGENATLKTPLL